MNKKRDELFNILYCGFQHGTLRLINLQYKFEQDCSYQDEPFKVYGAVITCQL